MPMVAKKSPYTLFVVDDNEPSNPRTESDNFSKMVCFHKRYSLGDKHDFKEPRDFLIDLVYDTVPPEEVAEMVKRGELANMRIEPDAEDEGVYNLRVNSSFYGGWYTEATFDETLEDIHDEIMDAALPRMPLDTLQTIAAKYNVIMPLFLYDHSVQTISTGSFVGRAQHAEWDSGMVGWAYADQSSVEKEFGAISSETLEKAQELINAEVELYDHFIRGDCYGFRLYEHDEEIDSCWGVIGDPSDIREQIEDYLPKEARGIMNNLEYQYDGRDIEDILETELESETEV